MNGMALGIRACVKEKTSEAKIVGDPPTIFLNSIVEQPS